MLKHMLLLICAISVNGIKERVAISSSVHPLFILRNRCGTHGSSKRERAWVELGAAGHAVLQPMIASFYNRLRSATF